MFHDNGKLQIFANTRCSNTNMYHYFNLEIYSEHTFPTVFNDNLIIVLRNPLDRVASAIKSAQQKPPNLNTEVLNKLLIKEITMESLLEFLTFGVHCNPFLYKIVDKPFRIIDFNKLSEYIPRKENAFQSPVTNSIGYTDPKSVYVENKYFTLTDLEIEYETYLALITSREQISVSEWKEKTSC